VRLAPRPPLLTHGHLERGLVREVGHGGQPASTLPRRAHRRPRRGGAVGCEEKLLQDLELAVADLGRLVEGRRSGSVPGKGVCSEGHEEAHGIDLTGRGSVQRRLTVEAQK
jgi:hypothetical protein